MDPNKKDESALDAIENQLYDPKKRMDDMIPHRVRDMKTRDLPTSWSKDTPTVNDLHKEKGFSFGTKFLIASCLLFILAMSFTAWRVFSSRNIVSSASIDMSADITPYVEGGESTPLIVQIHNRNAAQLQNATLTLLYKQGIGAQDEQEKIQEKRDIGTIASDEYKSQAFQVVIYGSEAELRDITLKLEYKVEGSNAVFSKIISTPVILKTPPISVHIDGPQIVSIGQDNTYTITVRNNSATTSLPSILQLTLPTTLTVESTTPKPSGRGQVWAIPALMEGESKIITINGSVAGSSGEKITMRAIVGSDSGSINSIGVVYSSQTFDISLRSSPLTFGITLDTDRGVSNALRYGDRATLIIEYTNTSEEILKDVILDLVLDGEAALYNQIDPGVGYYDSTKKTISWSKTTSPELAKLEPHAKTTLRAVIPIVTKGTNSPALKITLRGSGTLVEKDDVVAVFSKSWQVQGTANISAQTTYKNSPFQNTGPVPPQANVDTTYGAHLVVSAQNSLINTRVSFTLPAYVTWKNATSDNTKISYDSKTRTVTWLIGNLEAGKTIVADTMLSVRPSQSHVGQVPPITSGIILDADEEVSKAHIKTTISALTTYITGENWTTDPSRVIGQ